MKGTSTGLYLLYYSIHFGKYEQCLVTVYITGAHITCSFDCENRFWLLGALDGQKIQT